MGRECISFSGKGLDVDMAAFLSQHDVLYLTPGTEGYEGLPLGNGDLGAMAWTPADRIHFQINKCDTWDDAPDGPFGAWDDGNKAETYTALRHCGELEIHPGLPAFDWMYLEDFQSRLCLADAEASWFAKGPLGLVRCRSFVAREPKVLVIHYADELSEPVTRRVTLARWGSRVFEHWYATLRRGNLLGPLGTKASCDGDEIWIEQPTRSLTFAVACKIVTEQFEPRIYHRRQAGFELAAGVKCTFVLYLSVVTSEESDNPLAAARQMVRKAAEEGREPIFRRHKERWTEFWSKSFVDISNDYIENLWYINLYLYGSSSLGRYPPHFIGGLWSWSRDVRPWNHYYHWNQQQYTWPLFSSGHSELIEPYARWRLEGLPRAIEDARKVHDCNGAFYSDVANRKGYQDIVDPKHYAATCDTDWLERFAVLVNYNLTPGAQIAHDLYRHYEYTGDEEFLKKYTYPIMREWVRFMTEYLRLESDGLYHVPMSDPYETTWMHCTDATSTLAYIRLIFPIFIQLARRLGSDESLAETAFRMVGRLADYVYMELPACIETTGEIPAGARIVAAGRHVETGQPIMWQSRGKGFNVEGMALNAQLAPVFPAGLVGIGQKDTDLYQALSHVLLAAPKPVYGHNVRLICWARMGMADRMEALLEQWVDDYQIFPQGLFCYSRLDYEREFEKGLTYTPQSTSHHERLDVTNRVRILGSSPAQYVDLPTRPFAHMSLEPSAVLHTAINEMLLQSHEGVIRVFPATPAHWNARFTLHAVGGFVVTSEKTPDVKYVAVRSRLGRTCCVVNPWSQQQSVRIIDVTTASKISTSCGCSTFCFDTVAGHTYLLEREDRPVASFERQRIRAERNEQPKKHRRAILGKFRQY